MPNDHDEHHADHPHPVFSPKIGERFTLKYLQEKRRELMSAFGHILQQIPRAARWERIDNETSAPTLDDPDALSAFQPIREEYVRLHRAILKVEQWQRTLESARPVHSSAPRMTAQEAAALIAEKLQYKTEVIDREGKTFVVCDIPPEDAGEFSGWASPDLGITVLQNDLPPAVYRWIREHEIRHLLDRKFLMTYQGPMRWLLGELRASGHAFTDPFGFIASIIHRTKKNGMKRNHYLQLILKGQLFQGNPKQLTDANTHSTAFEKIRELLHPEIAISAIDPEIAERQDASEH